MQTGGHAVQPQYGVVGTWYGCRRARWTGRFFAHAVTPIEGKVVKIISFQDIRLPGRDKMTVLRKSYSGQPLLEATMDRIISRPISMMNSYHGTDIADLAATAAEQLASANGPRVAVFDINGFDTHAGQGNEDGELAYLLYELSNVVKELRQSLGGEFDNTLIMTLTEFGRMIEQNSGNGTEHGYGTAILGNDVGLLKKSQIFTDWPGIKKKDLFEGRDLNVTIDAIIKFIALPWQCALMQILNF